MIENPLTRRAALRLTGTAGLVGLFTKAGLKSAPVKAAGLVPSINEPSPGPAWAQWAEPKKAARKALDLMERQNRPMQNQVFDADLASLKSVSPAMKRHIQRVRDSERYDWLQRLQEVGWS